MIFSEECLINLRRPYDEKVILIDSYKKYGESIRIYWNTKTAIFEVLIGNVKIESEDSLKFSHKSDLLLKDYIDTYIKEYRNKNARKIRK